VGGWGGFARRINCFDVVHKVSHLEVLLLPLQDWLQEAGTVPPGNGAESALGEGKVEARGKHDVLIPTTFWCCNPGILCC
jgi:hypothetical protein